MHRKPPDFSLSVEVDISNLGESFYRAAILYLKSGIDDPDKLRHAISLLRSSAENHGNPNAANELGDIYKSGSHGIPQDYKEAFHWYQISANKNNAVSQANLGYLLQEGLGVTQNMPEAIRYYRLSAEQRNPYGLFSLACCYRNGEGVQKDDKEAARLYQLSADQKFSPSEYNLGIMYRDGRGVPQDNKKAFYWVERAANQNFAGAQFALGANFETGQLVPIDEKKALYWYRKAALQNHAEAQYNLGLSYKNGLGVEKDAKEAKYWLELAAGQDFPLAQYSLGLLYSKGAEEIPTDYGRAFNLFQLAAKQDHQEAQYLVACMYLDGKGTSLNLRKGFQWMKLAAENKYAPAELQLGFLYLNGEATPPDPAIAFSWFMKAAKHKESKAFIQLGIMYEKGVGVPQDYNKALQYFLQGTKKESPDLLIALLLEKSEFITDILPALQFLIKTANIEAMQALLTKPIKLSEFNKSLLLSYAIEQKQYKCTRILLENKATTAIVNNKTPLQAALKLNEIKFIELLLAHKAVPIEKDMKSFAAFVQTNLSLIIEKEKFQFLDVLPTTHLSSFKKKLKREDLLALSKKTKSENAMRKLLREKKELSLNILQIAILHGKEKLVETLLKKGIPINEPNNDWSPSKLASLMKLDIEKLLSPKKLEKDDKQVENTQKKSKKKNKNKKAKTLTTPTVSIDKMEIEEEEKTTPETITIDTPVEIPEVEKTTATIDISIETPEIKNEEKSISSEEKITPAMDQQIIPKSTTASLLKTSLKSKLKPTAKPFESKLFSKPVLQSRMLDDSKSVTIKDMLSDHGYQTMIFDLMTEDKNRNQCHKFRLVGATYNLLDRCFSKEDNKGKFSNNQENKSENFSEYWTRKNKQAMTKIFEILEKNSVDFMFLQEIDFVNPNHKFKFSSEEQSKIYNFGTDFIEKLALKGYDILISTSSQTDIQPMATIYRVSTFKFINPECCYGTLSDSNGYNRAWVTLLQHKSSGQFVSLMNLHLSYADSYFNSIIDLMKSNSKKNVMTIAGGDTNHTPEDIPGLVSVNPKFGVTNIQMSDNKLSTKDEKGRDKCYDGYFIGPPQDGIIGFQFGDCEVFQKNEKDVIQSKIITGGGHAMRFTKKGEPFNDNQSAPSTDHTTVVTRRPVRGIQS